MMEKVLEASHRCYYLSLKVERRKVDICLSTSAGRHDGTFSSSLKRGLLSVMPKRQTDNSCTHSSFTSDSFTIHRYRISYLRSSSQTVLTTTFVSYTLTQKSWYQRTQLQFCQVVSASAQVLVVNLRLHEPS
jgi:hypothetical protein